MRITKVTSKFSSSANLSVCLDNTVQALMRRFPWFILVSLIIILMLALFYPTAKTAPTNLTQTNGTAMQDQVQIAEFDDYEYGTEEMYFTALDHSGGNIHSTPGHQYFNSYSIEIIVEQFSQDDSNSLRLSKQMENDQAYLMSVLQAFESPDVKMNPSIQNNILTAFEKLNLTDEVSKTLIEAMFAEDTPWLAKNTFTLIAEADFDHQALIASIAEKSKLHASTLIQERALQLISDLDIAGDNEHMEKIDKFLMNLSEHPNEKIRTLAIEQRVWAMSERDRYEDMLILINQYLFDDSHNVRERMYEIIELEVINAYNSHNSNIENNLISLLNTQHIDINDQELDRINSLLSHLEDDSLHHNPRQSLHL